MPAPAIAWKLPIGTVAVAVGFMLGVVAAYYAGFSSSEIVLSSALGTGALLGITALAFTNRIRARLAGRYESAWLVGLWMVAASALAYLVNRIS